MTDKSFKIQAVLFDKSKMNLDSCFNFLTEYGFKIKKSFETDKHYHFQQYGNQYLKKIGYSKYTFKNLNDNVTFVKVFKIPTPTILIEEVPINNTIWFPTVIEICAFLAVVGFFVLSSSYYISK